MSDKRAAAGPDLREAATRPTRSISRRNGLPTGRAVVGALLVTFAVVGLFAAYQRSQHGPDTAYVVVAHRVQAGHRIAAEDLVTRKMQLTDDVAAFATTHLADAIGAIALETLLPGQLLQPDAVLAAGTGEESDDEIFEVSFQIDRARALGGDIRAGDRVDVVATISEGADACTTVIAADARVVSSQGTNRSEVVGAQNRDLTVTLAIEEPEVVLGTVFAVDQADVTIVRSTRAGGRLLDGVFCMTPEQLGNEG